MYPQSACLQCAAARQVAVGRSPSPLCPVTIHTGGTVQSAVYASVEHHSAAAGGGGGTALLAVILHSRRREVWRSTGGALWSGWWSV